ncbi:MAG: hypothetical protein KC421_17010, partial [Anaerolineales bacterium]|nr:hypothetical protein [Anaerolineales bacterium]
IAGFFYLFSTDRDISTERLSRAINVLLAPDLPTPIPVAVIPTLGPTNTPFPTPTPSGLLATWTPVPLEPSVTPKPSNTPRPSRTPSPIPTFPTKTATPTPTNTPTETPTITPTGPTPTTPPTRSAFPFTKTDNSPFYLQNFSNNAGCSWAGIAGEVLDLNRNPVPVGRFRVHIWGDGFGDKYVLVGSAPIYSSSGWELMLSESPSVREYNVQLESENGTAVSQLYRVQTQSNCDKNLLRIDFIQNH